MTVILAAGKGKRMKSDLPKVLHPLLGKPLVHYVIDQARGVGSDRIILVVSHKKEMVIEATSGLGVEWAVQAEPLGTADAVKAAVEFIKGYQGDVLVLSGDVPLLRDSTIRSAYELHIQTGAGATIFTFEPADPHGYGRIVRADDGSVVKIVEHKDASEEERTIREVNGGIYFFKADKLLYALSKVTNDNAAGEYYLTDVVEILAGIGERNSAYLVADEVELAGVNNPEQLLELEAEYTARGRK